MEENENKDQVTDEDFEDSNNSWLKDNLRIIISIIIVVVIAGGVYSYSKRNQTPEEKTQVSEEQSAGEEGGSVEIQKGEEGAAAQQQPAANQQKGTAVIGASSQETEGSFVETAGKGDSQTRLARRALANYLEKNPDSALTAEHKIYIEDYLRKNSGFKEKVRPGTTMEFSKSLISKSIESSKQLNDKQLKNLHKYALRVPSLT